jgi:hypothetical protein
MAHLPFVGRGVLWVDDDAGSHVEADAEAAAIGGQHLGFGELDAGEGQVARAASMISSSATARPCWPAT